MADLDDIYRRMSGGLGGVEHRASYSRDQRPPKMWNPIDNPGDRRPLSEQPTDPRDHSGQPRRDLAKHPLFQREQPPPPAAGGWLRVGTVDEPLNFAGWLPIGTVDEPLSFAALSGRSHPDSHLFDDLLATINRAMFAALDEVGQVFSAAGRALVAFADAVNVEQPPTDPRARALHARRHRNTGPDNRPSLDGRRRAKR